ncbi:MAG: RNA 3'-phosphate cyclase [Deltaproteobacteria bacterium]|nr:RNA 3'-phosphate cyclase [Deltaproteobacteria bacterium]
MTLEIDGSYGEGGGQILRTSLALAAVLQQPVKIRNIRAGRKKPGLRPQHLAGVRAMESITSACTQGAELGSTQLYFEPRQIRYGKHTVNIGTAGSTGLVLQAMLPVLLLAGGASQLTITGGTHVPWSPCFHYLNEVFVPALREMGCTVSLKIERWGWYPRGGGIIVATITPAAGFSPVEWLQREKLKEIHLLSAISNLPVSIAERQRDQALKRLSGKGYSIAKAALVEAPSQGTGTLLFIKARFENTVAGFASLGKKGKPAEKVADEASSDFLQFAASDASVDNHLADQLVTYMALAKGRSSFIVERITKHLLTNIWVVEQFLPVRFEIDKARRKVSVEGTGFLA